MNKAIRCCFLAVAVGLSGCVISPTARTLEPNPGVGTRTPPEALSKPYFGSDIVSGYANNPTKTPEDFVRRYGKFSADMCRESYRLMSEGAGSQCNEESGHYIQRDYKAALSKSGKKSGLLRDYYVKYRTYLSNSRSPAAKVSMEEAGNRILID